MPTEISAPLHLKTLLNGNKYVVADFHAVWCGPCKAVAPFYEQLSKANSAPGKADFVKINIDEQPELAAQYKIQAVPTFIVFKDGKPIEEIRSANAPALKKAVEKMAEDLRSTAAQEKTAAKAEVIKQEDEKTVSGSYGMTGGNNWKTSLR